MANKRSAKLQAIQDMLKEFPEHSSPFEIWRFNPNKLRNKDYNSTVIIKDITLI